MKHFVLSLAVAPLLLTACQSDQITSTWVPKEEQRTPLAALSNNHPQISWTLPGGWTEQPASDMRVGSFLTKGTNGQNVDISVVPLSGPAGGMLANINRWRGQIQLPPIEETQVDKEVKLITVGNRQMNYVDFASTQPVSGSTFNKRIAAAIFEHQGQTWFFKMSGEDGAVKSQKDSFHQFLTSLRFDE